MSRRVHPPETALLEPVMQLFPCGKYTRYTEVPLGRRRIDLVCVPNTNRDQWVAVELKVRDWWKAVWQATINFQLAEQSYIAIWHSYVHLPAKHLDMLAEYGIGLIEVNEGSARIVLRSKDHAVSRSRRAQRMSSFG